MLAVPLIFLMLQIYEVTWIEKQKNCEDKIKCGISNAVQDTDYFVLF